SRKYGYQRHPWIARRGARPCTAACRSSVRRCKHTRLTQPQLMRFIFLMRRSGLAHDNGRRDNYVLQCDNLSRWFGGIQALKNVSLNIEQGRIFGLVGPNGSGKTTLVNAITGFYPPQQGTITFEGQPLTGVRPHRIANRGIARTFQNVALFKGMSVLDNILMGRHIFMRPSALASLFYWWWAQKEEIAHRDKVEEIIDLLQLESVRDEPVEVIPLGLQKRVELARALAAEPRFLILDEPMAGMN